MTDRIECCGVSMSPRMHRWHVAHNHSFRHCPVCKKKIETMSSRFERPPYFYCSSECMEKVKGFCPNCLTAPYDHFYSGRCEKCRKGFGHTMKFSREVWFEMKKEGPHDP